MPKRDATAVARLKAAGAILLGKTNVPPLSADYRADNPIFGRTNNPWDLSRTPGGSTGGGSRRCPPGCRRSTSAATWLARCARPPIIAACSPSSRPNGRVPNTGHIPEPPGLPRGVRHMNVLGPLARSVEDLEVIMKVISGPDDAEWDMAPVPWREPADWPLSSCRFAWSTDFGGLPVTRDTSDAISSLADKLSNAGCKVERRMPQGFDMALAWETWGELVIAERASTAPDRGKSASQH